MSEHSHAETAERIVRGGYVRYKAAELADEIADALAAAEQRGRESVAKPAPDAGTPEGWLSEEALAEYIRLTTTDNERASSLPNSNVRVCRMALAAHDLRARCERMEKALETIAHDHIDMETESAADVVERWEAIARAARAANQPAPKGDAP